MIILASVNNISRKLLLFFLLFLGITSVFAQELQDSVSIYFHQGKTNIDLHFRQKWTSVEPHSYEPTGFIFRYP